MTTEHASPGHDKPAGQTRWIEKPENVRKIAIVLYAVCAFLLAIDFWIHKHGPVKIEHLWGFYGIYGFAGCILVILAAKVMRVLLTRGEDYYDR